MPRSRFGLSLLRSGRVGPVTAPSNKAQKMKKQYNVTLDDGEIKEIEAAFPGVKGGPAVRCAALTCARSLRLVVEKPAEGGNESEGEADHEA